MQLSNQEKITQCIEDAKAYFKNDKPNILVEYNFAEEPQEEWFNGFEHKFNEKCELGKAKFIYKMS